MGALGAGDLDYRELAAAVEASSGGIAVGAAVHADHTDPQAYQEGLRLSTHCLRCSLYAGRLFLSGMRDKLWPPPAAGTWSVRWGC